MLVKISSGKQLKFRLVTRILINCSFSRSLINFHCYFDGNRIRVLSLPILYTVVQCHAVGGTWNICTPLKWRLKLCSGQELV